MDFELIYNNVIEGKLAEVEAGVHQALENGSNPDALLNQALVPAMDEVGRLFERQEVYVPEMMVAARAMQAGLNILKPRLVEGGIEPVGRVYLGTVRGDLHDIGKNLVSMMLEGAGFEVHDLGRDVGPDQFVEAARAGADVIGISALLTTTMTNMKGVMLALENEGLRQKVKVIIGGAPITQEYADSIGADGYGADARSAVEITRKLVGVTV